MSGYDTAPVTTQPAPRITWRPRVAAAWTLAGGTAGGVFVAGLVLAGRMHPESALIVAALLAVVGSVLGCVHGAVLGRLGHPPPDPGATPWTERALAVGIIGAAAALALVLSLFLVMGAVLGRSGSLAGWATLAIAGAFATAAFLRATLMGWHALEHAYARWPDNRLGTLLVTGAFLVISAALLAVRPALPGTSARITVTGAVIIAALATLWLAAPVVIVVLRLTHHRRAADTGRSSRDVA
jgi:hypothetical protein